MRSSQSRLVGFFTLRTRWGRRWLYSCFSSRRLARRSPVVWNVTPRETPSAAARRLRSSVPLLSALFQGMVLMANSDLVEVSSETLMIGALQR